MKHRALAFAAMMIASSVASAQSQTIYVAINGGPPEEFYKKEVFPSFEQVNNVKIVVVPGTSSEVLAKLTAQKTNPQIDLAFLDENVMLRAVQTDLCAPIAAAPVYSQLYDFARLSGGTAVGIWVGEIGLAYQPKVFAQNKWAPPTSWKDFADPKYKNKVVIQSITNTWGLATIVMTARLNGGGEKDIAPALDTWRDTIGKNVISYESSSARISEMFQSGEAALAPLTDGRVAAWKSQGIDIDYASPKEGGVVSMVAACPVKGSKSGEMSQKLLQYVLSVDVQKRALEGLYLRPVNSTVKQSEASRKALDASPERMKHMLVLDWAEIARHRQQWTTRWNRTIEQ